MNKWIKLEDLPKGFWEECYIGWLNIEDNSMGVFEEIKSVFKDDTQGCMWYSEILKQWYPFDRKGFKYIIMGIERPTISLEDFK